MSKKDRYSLGVPPGERNYTLEHLLAALLVVAVVFALLMLSACERRELYVYGDEFHDVFLDVDWSDYISRDPDGMTVWFYDAAGERQPQRHTTANTSHYEFYLPGGRYNGLLIDYSPDEFSHQRFLGMDTLTTARVEARAAAEQPEAFETIFQQLDVKTDYIPFTKLYGDECWSYELPTREEKTGFYTVSDTPEPMALDTLMNMQVSRGLYGDYIPWEERNTYQNTLTVQGFDCRPQPVTERLLIRVFVRGIQYMWQLQGSLAGLSNGRYLASNTNTETPCLVRLDDWQLVVINDSLGYVQTTINTFGLRPSTIHGVRDAGTGQLVWNRTRADATDTDTYRWLDCDPEELRLNLRFTLRDRARVLEYQYDIGNQIIEVEGQHLLRADLDTRFFGTSYAEKGEPGPPGPPGPPGRDGRDGIDGKDGWAYPPSDPEKEEPDLPYADPYNGAGFSAEVTPWDEQPPIDVHF